MRVNGDSLLGGITHDGARGWGVRAGFTLTELLVALAVASVIFVGISALFWGSMRAVRTGYQAIHVDEQSRNALSVVERDLASAFTARQFGDYYQFYGTPIGFTLIGIANNLGESQNVGLARVTYVVYMGDRVKAYRDTNQTFDTMREFVEKSAKYTPAQRTAILAAMDEERERIEASSFETTVLKTGASGETETRKVCTMPLVRFVEPNVQELDNYPVDWATLMGAGDGSLNLPEGTIASDIQHEQEVVFRELRAASGLSDSLGVDMSARTRLADVLKDPALESLSPAQIQLMKAKKRELWIRMLAGDPSVPSLWDYWRYNPDKCPSGLSSNVADYIVATNLVYPQLEDPIDGKTQYLDLVRSTLAFMPRDVAAKWDFIVSEPWSLLIEPRKYRTLNVGNRLFKPFDVSGDGDSPNGLEDIVIPDPNDSTKFSYIDGPNQGVIDRSDAYRSYAPFAFNAEQVPYWSAETNVGPSDISSVTDQFGARDYTGVGSPLVPRIPAVVHVRLRFILPSPYIGAPDMVRLYTRAVDIPSGYARNAPASTS